MPAWLLISIRKDFPELWLRDPQKGRVLLIILHIDIAILDNRIVPHCDNEVSHSLPPIPRRDIEVKDIEVIVKTLEKSRRSHPHHHHPIKFAVPWALPSIRINNLAYVETS